MILATHLLFACLILLVPSSIAQSGGKWCDSQQENYCVSWIPMKNASGVPGVQITLSSPNAYWLGLGIGGTNMPGTKLYIFNPSASGTTTNLFIHRGIDDGITAFTASTSDAVYVPTPSGSPYVCAKCTAKDSSVFVASMWRPLSVFGDEKDVAVSPTTNFIWALGGTKGVNSPDDPAKIDYTAHTMQGTFQADMTTVATISPATSNNASELMSTTPSTVAFTAQGNSFTITVTRDPIKQLVSVSLQTTSKGYVAVGLGSTFMAGSTMFICWMNGNKPMVSQRTASGHVAPTPSGTNSATVLSSLPSTVTPLANAALQIAFTLPMSSISLTGPTSFIYAISNTVPSSPSDPSSSITQHDSYGPFTMDLTKVGATIVTSAPPSNNNALFKFVHAICMTAAWGFFPFIGVFTARYLKGRLGHTWYIIHLICMFGGTFILSITGMILTELTVPSGATRFSSSNHAILGTLITLAFLPLQVALGFISNQFFTPNRPKIPWWDQLHWWVGRLVMLAALVNIYFGIKIYNLSNLYVYIFIAWVSTMFILLISGQIFLGTSHHINNGFTDQPDDYEMNKQINFKDAADSPTTRRKFGGPFLKTSKKQEEPPSPSSPLRGSVFDPPVRKAPNAPATRPQQNYQTTAGLNIPVPERDRRPSGRGDAAAAFRAGTGRGEAEGEYYSGPPRGEASRNFVAVDMGGGHARRRSPVRPSMN